jgi:prolyl-tRNA synthetase
LLAEATAFRNDRMVDVATPAEAVDAASRGFARIRLGALGVDGEKHLAAGALSIRCLQRSDGSLAEPDDDEAALTAIVGRSY